MQEVNQPANADSTSQGGASESTNPDADFNRKVEQIVQKRLRNSAAKIADLSERLKQYEGVEDEEKETKPSNPLDAEYKSKFQRMEREKKSLLEKLDRHRQSTLRATVQQKLLEKDCIDPEVGFLELVSKGLVKLDDNDDVVVGGVYNDLDQLVEDYLSKKEYLRRSKAAGGVGSKAPHITQPTGGNFDKAALIKQIQAANTQGKKLFGT